MLTSKRKERKVETTELTLRKPDDFHTHLRDGDMLADVVPLTAASFARALAMPNTVPPLDTADALRQYRKRIMRKAPDGFTPLLCLYLTVHTDPETIRTAHQAGAVAAKLYPRGATTNSTHGVPLDALRKLFPAFGAMEELGMVLCLHGEDPDAFVMDRERAFMSWLALIRRSFPRLKIVFEHISSAFMAEVIADMDDFTAATVTPHHLVLTLDDVVGGKLQPHRFCMPVAKRPEDRLALRKALGCQHRKKFFAGTDSAPHPRDQKECAEGCAGVFNVTVALSVYARVFEEEDILPHLDDFLSRHGAEFYGLPLNGGTIRLVKETWTVPAHYGHANVVPLYAGQEQVWRIAT